jgi:IstB-like ATP binding protein
VIGNPTIADAILDRLVHNAHRLTLKGDSMRKIAAKRSGLDASPALWPHERADGLILPAFDWNGGRLQLESLAGIVGIRTGGRRRTEKACLNKQIPAMWDGGDS